MLLRRHFIAVANMASLLYLDQSEVSMCCKDGSDGKGGVYQLTPVFDDGLTRAATWSTSDATKATVNSSGLVSFSGASTFGDVTISCSYRGVTKSCLLTVYATMPSAETEGAGLWLCKGGVGSGSLDFRISPDSIPFTPNHTRAVAKIAPTTNSDFISSSILLKKDSTDYQISQASPFLSVLYSAVRFLPTSSETVYKIGPSLALAGKVLDIAKASNGYFINGVEYSLSTSEAGTARANVDLIVMYFPAKIPKNISSSWSPSATLAELGNRLSVPIMHFAQNYTRYTDRTVGVVTRVNYTVIHNVGTLGSTFDLSQNNVPASWFGV